MKTISLLFSVLFFFAFIFSSFFGIYILKVDSKASINRSLFAICISLSIWSFSFSIAISAPDLQTCLFWRRVSAIGWGTIFAELLLFFMILTEKRNILKRWWIYLLIFLPSIVVVYVFSISNKFAIVQYKLVNTSFGWTNISVNNGWDWFFYIYYLGYMIIGLVLLWNWKIKISDYKKKKQANINLYSFIVALLLCTMTDTIGNYFLSFNIPQISPIIIMIPVAVIYYSIKKFNFMNLKHVNETELILNKANLEKTYNYMALSFIAGSFINFISQYLLYENVNITSAFYSSASIALIGVVIQITQKSNLNEDYKHNIVIAIIAVIIPVITLKFVKYASVTIWAFPFIFIIISLVFNRQKTLMFFAVSILLTQLIVWQINPHEVVAVKGVDYIVRIGLFCIAIWLASYVNKIYILRLKENSDQISFQILISDISTSFVSINQMNFDDKISSMLELCGIYFQAERISVSIFDLEKNIMNYTHEWCREGIISGKKGLKDIEINENIWWIKQVISNKTVYLIDKNIFSKRRSEEKQEILSNDSQNLILIPIVGKEVVLGFLEFNLIKLEKYLRDDRVKLLNIVTNIFSDALVKINSEEEINYMAYYDHLTNLPNRLLFKDRVNQAIHLASRTEKMIGVILLDLDSFKIVNDTMGHDGGDELLNKLAKELSQCVRKCDTVSRFGGDEFLIMVHNISNGDDIVKIAKKIMDLFKHSFILKGQEFFVTASAGISVYPVDGSDTETLIKNADVAMYNAKYKGKNQYVLCTKEIKDEVQLKMKLTNGLHRALKRNELFLYYQPQVNIKSKKIIGLEALIRWNNPECGIIPPSIFIPLAEQTGLINQIGE